MTAAFALRNENGIGAELALGSAQQPLEVRRVHIRVVVELANEMGVREPP